MIHRQGAGGGEGRRPDSFRNYSAARRLGYRLLRGDGFSYLLHLRPREWPIMAAHTSLGYLLAVGNSGDILVATAPRFGLVLLVWVLLLNGGTLALNSAFDVDAGDIGYLDAPPPPPRYLAHFAIALMSLGGVISLWISPAVALAYGACFALSILYSVPPFRLKAVAGMDWLVNMAGFGALTPLAGWFASGAPLDRGGAMVLLGFAVLFAAFYPLTQIYQMEEDRARGDHTLVIALGPERSLVFSLVLTCAAFALFASGVAGRGGSAVPIMIVLPALGVWLAVLITWIRRGKTMSDAAHKRAMYHSLGAWAFTDVAVVLASLA